MALKPIAYVQASWHTDITDHCRQAFMAELAKRGVEADADLDLDAVIPTNLGSIAVDGLLHGECGIAGSHGVILVSEGRAEERHDAIAHDLVDSTLVTVHRLHHALDDGIQELARLLGVAVGEQLE
jgi:hypothetical protein